MPGDSIKTSPEEMREVAAAGHEIGTHGYSNENPVAMNLVEDVGGHGGIAAQIRISLRS
jgi:peptidoglycan/xylan/chitin deacetylase (PgdA/CDA1 family)